MSPSESIVLWCHPSAASNVRIFGPDFTIADCIRPPGFLENAPWDCDADPLCLSHLQSLARKELAGAYSWCDSTKLPTWLLSSDGTSSQHSSLKTMCLGLIATGNRSKCVGRKRRTSGLGPVH